MLTLEVTTISKHFRSIAIIEFSSNVRLSFVKLPPHRSDISARSSGILSV